MVKRRIITYLLKKLTPEDYNGFIIMDEGIMNFKVEKAEYKIQNKVDTLRTDGIFTITNIATLDIIANPYEFQIII